MGWTQRIKCPVTILGYLLNQPNKMNKQRNISISLAMVFLLMLSCKRKTQIDLAKLTFTEKAESIINYEDKYAGGINSLQSPLSFALQASGSSSFAFNGLRIDSADIIFQLRSDKIRKEPTLYQGGATLNQAPVGNPDELRRVLNKYQADSVIYAYRLGFKTKVLQSAILKELIKLYGPGVKNPNTDHGIYWNLKTLHRFVFYDPDYNSLIVVDNTNLSKTCFWDPTTGDMDFGGCDMEQYKATLLK